MKQKPGDAITGTTIQRAEIGTCTSLFEAVPLSHGQKSGDNAILRPLIVAGPPAATKRARPKIVPEASMPLSFESQVIDNKVAVIRCKGRITLGPEVDALESEVEKQTKVDGANLLRVKRVVLQLAETDFIDSSGLGSLVRLFGVFRSAGGGLKLCQMSDRVLKVIQTTNLTAVFPPYPSEAQAIGAFSTGEHTHVDHQITPSKTRIVCVDTSKDLLAGLKALLTRSGYEVLTTRYLGEAVTLVKVTGPGLVICGPGLMAVSGAPGVIENWKKSGKLGVLNLPSDFYTVEAGEAAQDLLSRVQALTVA